MLSPDETLDDSDRFNAARDTLGDDMTACVLPRLRADPRPLLESTGQAASDPDYQAAKPYLDALDFLVAGSKVDGDRTTASLVLGVKEASSDTSDDAAAAVITP